MEGVIRIFFLKIRLGKEIIVSEIVFGIVHGEPYDKSQKITHVYQFLKFSSLEFEWYIISLKYPPSEKRGKSCSTIYGWRTSVNYQYITPTR
jgi:hypothetical protein